MSSGEISDAVRQFIVGHVDSVPELEAILLLREHRERAWTAQDASVRLYVSVTVAAHILGALAARGILAEGNLQFRYAPATPALDALVAELATTYTRNLIPVTQLIHSKPGPSVLRFADAFRMRKDG
jgi:hypothetical protein